MKHNEILLLFGEVFLMEHDKFVIISFKTKKDKDIFKIRNSGSNE